MSSITIKQAHWIIANTERGTAPPTNLCNYNVIKEDAVDMLEQIQIWMSNYYQLQYSI